MSHTYWYNYNDVEIHISKGIFIFLYLGPNCEKITSCKWNPCVNGECMDMFGNYYCTCYEGYEGKNCSRPTKINECLSLPCVGNATCHDQLNG